MEIGNWKLIFMGLLDKFRKKTKKEAKQVQAKEKKKEIVKPKKREVKKEEKVKKPSEERREVVKATKVKLQSLAYRILKKPLISEKASVLSEKGKYVFIVDKKAKKEEVRQAISDIYGVKSEKINFINVKGKARRYGRTVGKTSDYKKAIVTLPKGKAIQVYEGV